MRWAQTTILLILSTAPALCNPLSNWTAETTNITNATFFGIVSGNNRMVAAGGHYVSVSAGGGEWQPTMLSATGGIFDVCYGNGQFVVIGRSIWTSTNGIQWNKRLDVDSPIPLNVAFGNGIYVGMCQGSGLRSVDGITWTRHSGVPNFPLDVAFVNGGFMIADLNAVYTSSDGINWVMTPAPTLTFRPNTISSGNGLIVVAGSFGKLATSTNGVDWSIRQTGTTHSLYSSVHANGVFLIGGDDVLLSSEDGVTWTKQIFPPSFRVWVGDVGFGRCYVADKGILFSSGDLGTPWLRVRRAGNTLDLFATGELGGVYTLKSSPDLVEWTPESTYTNSAFTMHVLTSTNRTTDKSFYRVER